MLSQLLCLGRHTVTGVLTTAGRLFCDWTADYRMYSAQARFQPEALFAPVRRALRSRLKSDEPLVIAVDDTRLRKTGRKICGVKYTRDPLGPHFHVNFIKAQRMLQLSMACVVSDGMARMIPVDFVHAPPGPKPARQADEQERAQCARLCRQQALSNIAAQRVTAFRADLDQHGDTCRPLWVVADGGYTNHIFIKQRPPRTILIGRMRQDAKLYHLPEPAQIHCGRHRVYGLRAPTPEYLRQDPSVPWQPVRAFAAGKFHEFRVKTLAPLRWRAAGGACDLRLIVIAPLAYRLTLGSRLLYRRPAYLLCTDPQAPVEQVLQAYLWRWDIEVNFRDEKTLLGLGQAQVRGPQSVEKAPALVVAAYAMLLTAAWQTFGASGKPDGLPPPKWRKKDTLRASTQSLINQLRMDVWAQAIRFCGFASGTEADTKPEKLSSCLDSAIFYSTA